METKKIEIKQIVAYSNYSVKENGIIKLILKSEYSELTKTVQLLQLLNNDVLLYAKTDKVYKLGLFRINNVVVDSDGESKISLTSTTDYTDTNALNQIILQSQLFEKFSIKASSEVEVEVKSE